MQLPITQAICGMPAALIVAWFAVRPIVRLRDQAQRMLHADDASIEQWPDGSGEIAAMSQALASYESIAKETTFSPVNDSDLAHELSEREPGVVWITKQALWPKVQARIVELGYRPVAQGTPYYGRVIFRVVPVNSG